MSNQKPRQALNAAFRQLSAENKSLVRRQSLRGEFTPQKLLEQLSELKLYAKKVSDYQAFWRKKNTREKKNT